MSLIKANAHQVGDYTLTNEGGKLVINQGTPDTVLNPVGVFGLNGLEVEGGTVQDVLDAVTGPTGAASIGYTPAGTGAVATTVQAKLREQLPSITDYFISGEINSTGMINRALETNTAVLIPPGVWISDGGHNIQGKTLIGCGRDVSIIKASGSNSGVTLFTGARTNPTYPGGWGSGGAFRLENLGIHGNWDGTSGLTLVGSYNTGVLSANYNATLNTALVKGVSTVYTFIKNCQFAYAYEHAVLFYGNGYSEIDGNIFTTCRGSAIWFAGDKSTPESTASSTSTSTTVEDNQITTCRGGNGALIMHLTYGYTVRGNLFEANVYGYNLAEGADCSFTGNYSELGYTVGDNVGIAPVLIDNAVWGYTFIGEAYNPLGDYLPANPRSAVAIGRNGVQIAGTAGYGGAGIKFPASKAPSTNANTLDDYEEGTWAPNGFNVVFTYATGKYTKIGNLVTLTFKVVFPVTTNTDAAYIAGLPFVPASEAGVAIGVGGGRASIDFTCIITAGNLYITALNAPGTAFMTNANFSGGTIVGSATYHV